MFAHCHLQRGAALEEPCPSRPRVPRHPGSGEGRGHQALLVQEQLQPKSGTGSSVLAELLLLQAFPSLGSRILVLCCLSGVPQQGMEGGSWISPCGSADANTWVGGQDEDRDIPCHKMVQVGCGGRMSCWGDIWEEERPWFSGVRRLSVHGNYGSHWIGEMPTHVLVLFHL